MATRVVRDRGSGSRLETPQTNEGRVSIPPTHTVKDLTRATLSACLLLRVLYALPAFKVKNGKTQWKTVLMDVNGRQIDAKALNQSDKKAPTGVFAAESGAVFSMTKWRISMWQGVPELSWAPGAIAIRVPEASIPEGHVPATEQVVPRSVSEILDPGESDMFTVLVTVVETTDLTKTNQDPPKDLLEMTVRDSDSTGPVERLCLWQEAAVAYSVASG